MLSRRDLFLLLIIFLSPKLASLSLCNNIIIIIYETKTLYL